MLSNVKMKTLINYCYETTAMKRLRKRVRVVEKGKTRNGEGNGGGYVTSKRCGCTESPLDCREILRNQLDSTYLLAN